MNAIRWGVKLLVATLGAGLALAASLWFWSDANSSLATLVQTAQRYLPAGQTLETKDIQGSLRTGGHIGWLRWRQAGLSVEAFGVDVAWTLRPLLDGRLQLSQLSVASLHINDQRTPSENVSSTPPMDLRLPIKVEVPFSVAKLSVTGATSLDATGLAGNYSFDSYSHRIDKGLGHISSGNYQFKGELQALPPMALALALEGRVQTTLPSSHTPLSLVAQAQLTGELAGPDAALALQATLQPDLDANKPNTKLQATQATLSAFVHPWHTQPLTQANAQWQALDLAALWPQAPRTQLTGTANVVPAGEGWQGKLALSNVLPGPWNQQYLPVQTLKADVSYVHDQWLLQSVRATAAGGVISGDGGLKAGQWQGQLSLQNISPAAIDSRLASVPVSGTLKAQQTIKAITFAAQFQATQTKASPLKSTRDVDLLQLQRLEAQGQWATPLLTLSQLHISTPDASLLGQLSYHTLSQALQGQLALTLPGANGQFEGDLASTSGQGTLAIQVTDAAQATRWLSRVPVVGKVVPADQFKGAAELKTSWQGGWQSQGRSMKIQATLRAPEMDWTGNPGADAAIPVAWHLSQLQADLSGTLADMQLRTQGQAKTGERQMDWQAQLSGGQRDVDHWQGYLNQFRVNTQGGGQPGTWSLQLADAGDKPLRLDWQQSGLTQTMSVAGGTARLTGPQASTTGVATLHWQALNWSSQQQPNPAAPARTRWQSKGSLTGIPLAWLDALGGKTLEDIGLGSNMVLNGQWDAAQADTLQLSASLVRSAGDLQIRAAEHHNQVQAAGVRDAQLQVRVNANDVVASLRWVSDRAGRATADLRTQLQSQNGQLAWAMNAPVAGSLNIQMPPIAAWSVLAPPGWRLRGTLDANATLTGTRSQPQWRGTLQAKDLAVRSVADGIDFQQGTLVARLDGQQLVIEDFTLFGPDGAAGGQVKVTGVAQWLPALESATGMAQRVRITLDANAKTLRLSNRADRRITVSGHLAAQLKDTQLSLRGKLTADQALLTLPSENTPVLGDDVVVRPSASQATQQALTKRNAPTAQAHTAKQPNAGINPDVQVTLDLGSNFQVRGRGLDTRLAGSLELRALGTAAPTLTGTVRTVRGTYQAYGQRLDIEQGLLRFVGAVDNPVLDILAIRPKLTQRVGVQVNGTALSPIVRLYAEPELPEAEKLAWLVMGRSASGSGGELALLQQAALALLGSQGQGPTASLSQALGLDEFSVHGNTGESTAAATLTVGKRFSNDFYMAYESGLAGTMGVFSIFYDLSKKLTLRAKTGEQTAVDLIWTQRYD